MPSIITKPYMRKYLLYIFLSLSFSISASGFQSRMDTLRWESDSIIIGGKRTVHFAQIYLPDSEPTDSLPVLYLFHGFMGNQHSWEEKAGITALLDSLIEGKAIRKLMVVMPYCIPRDTMQAVQLRSALYNIFHYGRLKRGEFERTFSDMDAYLKQRYPMQADSACAIAGLSYGARVAANIALERTYKAVGLFSPVIDKHQYPPADSSYVARYWVRVGGVDFFEPSAVRFRKYMTRHNLPIDYATTDGAHNWRNWRRYLIDFLKQYYSMTASQDSIELRESAELTVDSIIPFEPVPMFADSIDNALPD